MKLFVANIAGKCTEEELEKIFAKYGKVKSVKIIRDRETGHSRGFGFVEMTSSEEGKVAIQELNKKEVQGRALVVAEAQKQRGDKYNGGSQPGRGRVTSKKQ